jgi:hypothetical protein
MSLAGCVPIGALRQETRSQAVTFETPAQDLADQRAFGPDRDRRSRWFETAVTAFTGLVAIAMVSLAATALGLN